MNTIKTILSVGSILFALVASADAGIANTVIRQRWPWSSKVDIEFTVTGETTDVELSATYDGLAVPVVLKEKDIEGELYGLEPGVHRLAWDPVGAGLGETALKGFSVTVTPAKIDRTYLILDLVTGDYEYAAAEPEGGWIANDSAYYQTKMVFRRVPAGTSNVGFSDEILDKFSDDSKFSNNRTCLKAHTVTLSDDYYLGVYSVTKAQDSRLTGGSSTSRETQKYAYNTLRGEESEIDWPTKPTDIYEVGPTNTIRIYRNFFAGKLPKEWTIDLPTLAQWERATKATTPDGQIWSVGGTVDSTMDEIKDYISQVAVNGVKSASANSSYVGQLKPNGWGFYDMCGLACHWVLDHFSSSAVSGTDPLGGTSGNRTRLSLPSDYKEPHMFLPGFKGQNGFTSKNAYRLCIHLKKVRK